MPGQWQCDTCGTRYKVAWLSHCPRCEAMPPPKRPASKKGTKMPKANHAGTSNAWERAVEAVEHGVEKLVGELRGEHGPELLRLPGDGAAVSAEAVLAAAAQPAAAPESVAPTVEPVSAPVAVEPTPEPVAAPVAAPSVPATSQKGSAA